MKSLLHISVKISAVVLLSVAMLLLSQKAFANDYLEKEKHYAIYSNGANSIHFVIPVWAYGRAYDYYAYDESYIAYTVDGGSETRIAKYKTDKYDENENSNSSKGTAYVSPVEGEGVLIVTSMASGVNYRLTKMGDWSEKLYVKQKEDDDCPQVTFLELDWYPPESLNKKNFKVKIVSKFRRSYTDGNALSCTVSPDNMFTSNTNIMTPQLYSPYIYQVNEGGPAGYGYAAIPFMLFNDPISYTTTLNSAPQDLSDRGGTLYVMTTDTVQEQFKATFTMWYGTGDSKMQTTKTSVGVDIPPYHRIYDFTGYEETDSTGTYTGNNVLSWTIKNPGLKDLVDGDYFELQRASQSDFSDARTIEVVQMQRNNNKTTYTYEDKSRETWTGNATVIEDSLAPLSHQAEGYILRDNHGNPLCEMQLVLTDDNVTLPAVPTYYRIRRASSSIWGWDNDFTHTAYISKHNFLAPLAAEQENYTLDADFDNNRLVHFKVKIDNAQVEKSQLSKDRCKLSYKITRDLSEDNYVSAFVNFSYINGDNYYVYDSYSAVYVTITNPDGQVIKDNVTVRNPIEFTMPKGSSFRLKYSGMPGADQTYVLTENCRFDFSTFQNEKYGYNFINGHNKGGYSPSASRAEELAKAYITEDWKKHISDSLYSIMNTEYAETFIGRCMWDRTAQLVLTRTIAETGQSTDFIIPQDSIYRLSDGSWVAAYSDVADKGCSTYMYSVRIDQSRSDLHVQDSASLKPIALSGPSLYFDEAAKISRLVATDGDASTAMKSGVLVRWETNSSAVDEFVLTRLEKGSSERADTLYAGTEYNYFDRTAKPDVRYEYTISARYSCNGKTTYNAATTEGRRTPYGEISGVVQMPDNSGMAGVKVALQDGNGNVVRTMLTDATGVYKFDSLNYIAEGKAEYRVVPTHSYGTFSFNNTSSPSATITLSPANAVADGLDFVNTSSTRLSGRVLYKASTIPVAGVMFVLNGDTVRRGNLPVKTGTDGHFELLLPFRQSCRLQVFKPGHVFEGDGILRKEGGEDEFTLDRPLDGVRFYDMTKVRLIGRVAGGNDQRDLPAGFGQGKNNLGDNVQLVLQLEGDNTAQIVHDPDDLTKDSINTITEHTVTLLDPLAVEKERVAGTTHTLFEKKRITIHPDPETGEYAVDLFPVKYKVIQASATGYATLFATGQGNETFDLTEAPLHQIEDTVGGETVSYNAVYDRIYHTPMQVSLTQMIYGLEREGLGEPSMEVSHIDPAQNISVDLYEKQADGSVKYLLDYPVFIGGRYYQFTANAYEDYYYNNDRQSGNLDRVPLRGGSVTIHNGMHGATEKQTYELDRQGRNTAIHLMVDDIDANNIGQNALRTVSISLEQEGNTVETNVFKGFISGTTIQEKDLRMTEANVVLLDIVRDPGGAGSSAWIESGSTYNYSYEDSYEWETGMKLGLKYGLNVSSDIGIVTAPSGVGSYTGSNYTTSKQLSVPFPITHKWSWAHKYDYSITTSERISTSASSIPDGVGAMADVFFGTTVSQVAGKAKTISLIGDSLYNLRKPAIDAGAMRVIAQGMAADGSRYYLVTGQKIVLGSTLNNTFAYTQHYILNTVIPEIAIERQNLLMQFGSREEARAAANARGEEVYWYHPEGALNINDTLPENYYEMVKPDDDNVYIDRVAALNRILAQWITIIYQNEKEKVAAMGVHSTKVGTYSVSYGATVNHTDSYSASANYNELPQGWGLVLNNAERAGTKYAQSLAQTVATNLKDFFGTENADGSFGKSAADALKNYYTNEMTEDGKGFKQKNPQELGTVTNASKFSISIQPILTYDTKMRDTQVKTVKKSAGFNIVADPAGDITVSAYRVPYAAWADTTAFIRNSINTLPGDDDALYGSYVFYTDAGATFCPHENEERTLFYNKGTLVGNGTQWIVKPEMTADTYEITNVQPHNKAVFRVQLMNNSEVDAGLANNGHSLTLVLDGTTNPDGAKVTVDGMPLTQGISYWILPGTPIIKTVEVERGTTDDYNLGLMLYVSDCPKTLKTMNLAVHFLPEAGDVNISMPRQNWIMNTLSARDSAGYYLPVEIDGFDIHHKNFDHIEFQYKLSTESEEMWVNQCSFYASDSLYALATGNKAMIENGRIVPFRFYGERDPMEQRYDLRAVSFCRYGSGFVTKSSPVISGTKDTRPPRVFGEPEPVNAILGVGENLRLRFNEPIAGNYLDEDNNFQLLGVTNASGITTNASVHFDGSPDSYAATQVNRSLQARSYSIDMIVKPTSPTSEVTFFEHGFDRTGIVFGRTADNRLQLQFGTYSIYSKPLTKQMLDFTRVVLVYNYANNTLNFYAGTEDVTDTNANTVPDVPYTLVAPLVFGRGMEGNMLEVRLWTKPLTQEEINATNLRYLTGYEQELAAYYKMNEGAGTTLKDLASGATMQLHGASWNLPKGISLALTPADSVALAQNVLSRSDVYDATYLLWFRNKSANGTVFRAGDKRFALSGGNLQWWLNDSTMHTLGAVGTDEWHHIVLAVNRTYNNVAVYIDGLMTDTYPATQMSGISGDMYFGGSGFEGNIDEFIVFEQALPKTIIEEYGNRTPMGDEMGLMAYLPFEEQRQNANGVLELVFSANDQRQFRDVNGNVIEKQVPLILEGNQPYMADKNIYAPVHGFGLLSKLNFDWAFNQDELLINLKMADREINKQTVCVTVRDVEDLNGNPMPSPVMWVAYVDRNSLTWENNAMNLLHYYDEYDEDSDNYYDMRIVNNSGKRHQFIIESLPDWLIVDKVYGTIQPTEDFTVRFSYDISMPVGEYTDIVYVTDETGLSEPLKVTYTVKANCPWSEPERGKYSLNMSVCGQLVVNGTYSTNPEDKVIALYRNECVGMANVAFDNMTNKSDLFLTVYGSEPMKGKQITFLLWQASTGKVISLLPSEKITFAHGNVYGCGSGEPVVFTATGSEVQNISLNAGWNWVSFNVNVNEDASGVINDIMTAAEPWREGDVIKNTVTRKFSAYSDTLGRFVGSLDCFNYIHTHMVYSRDGNTMRVSGNRLPADSMKVTLQGSGAWSPLPCLYGDNKSVPEALAGYYDYATAGDILKSHDRFAVFSEDKRWVGNLTAIRPGEGYFFRRMGQGSVLLHFYQSGALNNGRGASGRKRMSIEPEVFHNHEASVNMTMIVAIEGRSDSRLIVYAGSELAGVAEPAVIDSDTLYFLTIQSDKAGEPLRFMTEDGQELNVIREPTIYNTPNSHFGTLGRPVVLAPVWSDESKKDAAYKIIENDRVIIIRGGEKYDIVGQKYQKK